MIAIHGRPAIPDFGSALFSQMPRARHFMIMKASAEPRNMIRMPTVAS